MQREWVEQWRDAMRGHIERLLPGFEARFGFPPGTHEVSGPASAAELAGLTVADLVTFHEVVGEVRLPDVHHGYWIHRPATPGEDVGLPHALTDGRRIAVFGSDGGGALFALIATSGAPVLRLAAGADADGVYDADDATVVARDLQDFLTLLRAEIEEFVAA